MARIKKSEQSDLSLKRKGNKILMELILPLNLHFEVVVTRSKRFGGQIFQQKPLRPFITFAQPLMEEFAITQVLSIVIWVQFYRNVQDSLLLPFPLYQDLFTS